MIENTIYTLASIRIKNLLTGTILGSCIVAAVCIAEGLM